MPHPPPINEQFPALGPVIEFLYPPTIDDTCAELLLSLPPTTTDANPEAKLEQPAPTKPQSPLLDTMLFCPATMVAKQAPLFIVLVRPAPIKASAVSIILKLPPAIVLQSETVLVIDWLTPPRMLEKFPRLVKDPVTGIILSPGPGQPKEAGKMMEVIQQYQNDLPIFGVCLGMQALGQHFGATLERASFPMHGKVSTLTFEEEHPMFQQVNKPLEACRYHSLILTNLEHTALQILAQTPKDEPMALAHDTLPIWAVQFHPEAILTPQGLKLINNWLTCFGLKDTKPVAV